MTEPLHYSNPNSDLTQNELGHDSLKSEYVPDLAMRPNSSKSPSFTQNTTTDQLIFLRYPCYHRIAPIALSPTRGQAPFLTFKPLFAHGPNPTTCGLWPYCAFLFGDITTMLGGASRRQNKPQVLTRVYQPCNGRSLFPSSNKLSFQQPSFSSCMNTTTHENSNLPN